jgi:hypothetical protein
VSDSASGSPATGDYDCRQAAPARSKSSAAVLHLPG